MMTDVLPELFAAAIADCSEEVSPSSCVCACTSAANPENKPASITKHAFVKIRRTTGLPWETVGVAVDCFEVAGIRPRLEAKKASKDWIRGISTLQILRAVIIRVKLELQPTDRIEVSNSSHN